MSDFYFYLKIIGFVFLGFLILPFITYRFRK